MKIGKKIIACAAVCAVFGVGVTAYAAGNAAKAVPELPDSSVEDIVKVETSDISADENTKTEIAESVPEENTVSAVDPERIPHVMPSKFALEDMDLINTGVPGWCVHTFIPAELNSEVYASADGEVVYANYSGMWCGGYGSAVAIKHKDGLYTVYGFLNPVEDGGKAFVEVGDTVKAGQCIGLAGFSGMASENGVAYVCYTELPSCFSPGYYFDTYVNKDTDAVSDRNSVSIPAFEEIDGYVGVIVDADGDIVEYVPASGS